MSIRNAIPDLCELQVRIVSGTENIGHLNCIIDLRLSCGEIPLGNEECEVAFERIIISVDCEGLDIDAGTRFGEPKKSNAVSTSRTSTRNEKVNTSSGGNLNLSIGSKPSGGLDASRQNSTDLTTTTTSGEEGYHLRVKARPNGRWEVTEPDREPLDGTYMENDSLFTAQTAGKSNRSAISIDLKVKQRDLSIRNVIRNESAISFFKSISKNHKLLIDIFIAKSLSKALYGNRRYTGEISLSQFEYIHEE